MARYRRSRRYRRKSGRWASNITTIDKESILAPVGAWNSSLTLATNPIQSSTGVSQTFTAKNFEISFTLESSSTTGVYALDSIAVYIMYVPQGMNITSSYMSDHPEYILNYKFYGSPTSYTPIPGTQGVAEYNVQRFQPMKIKSRLSRKLQTGDSIILFMTGVNGSDSALDLFISGVVRWWTKAN